MNRLERLLRPKSIAVFGGHWSEAAVLQSEKMGFSGDIWPVHPNRKEIAGRRAYRSVAELPQAPDAAFVAVNRRQTIGIVGELARRGAGGAVCFASGFREASGGDLEGSELQNSLLQAAADMPILGPNCYGLINYADGAMLWPDQHGGTRLAQDGRGAAVIAQSSNIAINLTMQARGLPLAYVATVGNQAQTGLSEIALELIEDERVSVLGLYIEEFDSVPRFEALAQRSRELGKPVIALKAGRSEQARTAATSHTASLAGSDTAASAFLKRIGIARAHSIPALVEALKLMHVAGPLDGYRVSSMSCSGGEACMVADAAVGHVVAFPPLAENHRERVQTVLGPLAAAANPLDYHTFIWNDARALTETFTTFVAGGFDFNLLVLDFPRRDRCTDDEWLTTVDAFESALGTAGAKGGVVATLPENLPEHWCHELMARGIVPLHGIDDALDAIACATEIGVAWRRSQALPVAPARCSGGLTTKHTEAEAKRRLAEFALRVPASRVVDGATEAAAAAIDLGFPVAVKALGIAHKTEQQAVRLDLRTEQDVVCAAGDLLKKGARILVERMVTGHSELIVGVLNDPHFGPVLTIGSGGVLVELLSDVQTLLLPATRVDVEEALESLRIHRLLDGYRGRPRADIEAAIGAILNISEFALANADTLVELDINPLILCDEGQGAWIADALLVTEELS